MKRPIVQVALSPDGSTAYGLREAGSHFLRWGVAGGHELPPLRYEGSVSRLALSRDGKLLAAIVQTGGRAGV